MATEEQGAVNSGACDAHAAQLHRRRLGRGGRRRDARGPQPGDRRADRAGAALGRRRRRRRRARGARGPARVARGRAAEARPRRDGAARGAVGAARGDRPAGHRGHGQDARRRPRRGRCAGSSRPRPPARSRTCSRARTSRASPRASTSSSSASRSAWSRAITPFNFPAMIPLWFLPFAIACGNTLHPQAVRARPAPVGADLRADRRDRRAPRRGPATSSTAPATRSTGCSTTREIDAISFVGQASTARYIAERSAATGKRFQALGGAKNSLVVMPDADLDTDRAGDHVLGLRRRAASAASPGRSRCSSAHAPSRTRPSRRSPPPPPSSASGPGDQEGVEVCPLVGPEARERIAGAIERGRERRGRGDPRRPPRRPGPAGR